MRVICFFVILLSSVLSVSAPALAQTVAMAEEEVIQIAPDKPEILKIQQEASSVIVGNPAYASVTMDNPTTLLIIPRAEGTTSLTVLNKKGEIIMERRLNIGGPQDKYVRIRRACTPDMTGCISSSTYYCPDGCTEVSLSTPVSGPAGGGAGTSIAADGTPVVLPMDTPPALPAGIQPISAADLEKPQ